MASEQAKVQGAPPPLGLFLTPQGVPLTKLFLASQDGFLLSLKLPDGPLDVAPEVWRRTLLTEEGNGSFGASPISPACTCWEHQE